MDYRSHGCQGIPYVYASTSRIPLPGMTPSLASHCWCLFNFGQNTRLMNKNKKHTAMADFHRYPVKKKATSMEPPVEFKHPLFQLERNTKHNGQIFSLVTQSTLQKMATSIEAVRVFKLIQCLKFLLERRKKLNGHGPT